MGATQVATTSVGMTDIDIRAVRDSNLLSYLLKRHLTRYGWKFARYGWK